MCWSGCTDGNFVSADGDILHGRRPLIVRKRRRDDALIARLKMRGARPLEVPVMRMGAPDPVHQAAAEQVFQQLQDYTMAAFISPYVAELVLAELERRHLQLAPACHCLAVGQGTAAVLRDAGYEVTAPGLDMTSEGLLEMSQLADLSGENIVIFRGEGGRRVMDQAFVQRGARITSCLLYRREPDLDQRDSLLQAVRENAFDAVVVHSGELLSHMAALLPDDALAQVLRYPLVVPHARVADKARDLGAEQVEIACNASTDAIEAALAQCYS